jgi:hypothetical protein
MRIHEVDCGYDVFVTGVKRMFRPKLLNYLKTIIFGQH